MIVTIAVTQLTVLPALNAVNLVITPTFTGAVGATGISQYQSYLATTLDNPKKSEAVWSAPTGGGVEMTDVQIAAKLDTFTDSAPLGTDYLILGGRKKTLLSAVVTFLGTTPGAAGRGIVSNVRTSGNGAAGTTDTYTITYTDATTTTYTVVNGVQGSNGISPTIGVNGNWYVGATDTGVKAQGIQGIQGLPGAQGVQGLPGAAGANGAQGIQGPAGSPDDAAAIKAKLESITVEANKLNASAIKNAGAYKNIQNDATGGTITMLPNQIINMRNRLTANLTLALDSTLRSATETNEYVIKVQMANLFSIIFPSVDVNAAKPIVIRWAFGVPPIVTSNSKTIITLLEELNLTTNLWNAGADIVTNAVKQKYTLSAEGAGNIVVKSTLVGTMSRAGTTVTGVGTAFTADMVGSTLFIGGVSQGTVNSWTSATVVIVSGSGTTASSTGDARRTLTGTGARVEMTFAPNTAGATLNFANTGMTNIQFENREYATPYVATSTPTETTTYLGRTITN